MSIRQLVVAATLMGLAPLPATAQSTSELLDQAVRAYQDLEFDAAAAILRRVLTPGEEIVPAVQADALAYLAATELFRGRRVSATTTFRRLVRFDPRYRPDDLVFPPEVTNLFDEIRRETKATQIDVPVQAEVRVGADRYRLRVVASSLHDVTADVKTRDGGRLRLLYRGPVADSLDLGWDGLDESGVMAPTGRYVLTVSSLEDDGRVASVAQLPVDVEVRHADTLPRPAPLADSLFLPERRPAGPGLEALAGGVLIGAAVLALPSVFAPGSDASEARLAVGGAISLAGITGFLMRRPGQPLPANAAANAAIRRDWSARLDSVEQENVRRKADIRLRITVASGAGVTPGQP